ncbi:methylmalonyl-CoA carboxyltransferase [Siccirubricoccus sp. KC 17139]|uniref:Methylmalonyl-CoA carboxyltransferase n=1 Tax=Siccirubricoccus soli TaxID=2899147 RepID=A0ABT1D2S0_9PROT|nr:carboxyl transferase domain-containing protein [Siccirubricoccus soli]MCO6416229.1 methylmalonyl-CoA carboxyltransferase [Siccirubricoccus soli]MCP2682363.1 methylmalonyl-CoA carboxyltransferase [Siccirubricoccus soli]
MSWQPELDELRAREAMAKAMGGPDKVARQHQGGRLTVRERIDAMLDPHSFHEVGAIAGRASYGPDGELKEFTPSNCVMGRGSVEGRPVVIVGDDFTVRGGSADATIRDKPIMAERMAAELRLPIIRIIEGSGGGGSVKTIETTGRANLPGGVGGTWLYHHTGDNLSRVPVVALGLGSVAGLGAARLAASHFSVMTRETSAMFVAGPPVVNAMGNNLSKSELGGWEIQCKAGAVDHAVDSEEEAFAAARRFLSYLPSSVFELPKRLPSEDEATRREEGWLSVIPRDIRKPYRARALLEGLMDRGSVFEMGRYFGRSIITALARLNGLPVAVIMGDPMFYAGSWTADACAKVIRFVDLADTFHLPVVHLMDCPGFMIGLEAEKAATIRWGVRAMAAINQCSVPWCTVVLRNAFGVAGAIHQPANRYTIRYAWPSARWGSLPLEGGIEAAYRADIDAAEDPAAKLVEIEARLQKLRSPLRTAEAFWAEEIIDPRETRRLLCEFATLAERTLEPGQRARGLRP